MSELPSYNLTRIVQLRDKLVEEVFYPRFDVTIEESVFRSTVDAIRLRLPRDISGPTVYESSRQLLGQILTPQLSWEVAWRLAGNVPRLQQGEIVTPWVAQREPEWVPVQVVRIEPGRHPRRNNEFGAVITVQVLAGSSCPLRLESFWKRGLLGAMAQRIGFTPHWKKRPFSHAEQYAGLRFLALIDPKRCEAHKPGYFEIAVPDNMMKWNVDVLKRRFKEIPCPRNWVHECHNCAQGFEVCPAATHFRTYVAKFCAHCGQDALFDPESHSLYCVPCTRKFAFAKKQS
jgi:hypothetical protein